MALKDNKLLVRRYYQEIVNTGSTAKIENFISPEYSEVHDGKKHTIAGNRGNKSCRFRFKT
jgi:hypothetical protein